jgi:type I restriction enzyme S subunit
MPRSLSELAQVNPQVNFPEGAGALTPVSFVPMADVTESGHWIGRHVRALREVSNGFTAFADGDILIAKITPCFENGKGAHVVGLTNGIGFGSTEFHVLRARDGVSPRFVYHVAQSSRLRMAAEAYMSGSAGQKRVPLEFFDAFSVPDLPQQEQQKISVVLDTLDTTIRQTEAIIEKLKQVKQGLLHDLLTRGIDSDGELRPPRSQAPHLYKDSPLGWIPREWTASSIDAACSDVVDCPHSTPSFRDDGVLVARTMHIKAGVFLERNASRVSESEYRERIARLRPEPGDVVFTREAPVGEAFVIPAAMRICLGQRVMLLRPRPEVALGQFLLAQIYSGAVADRIAALTAGTTNPHLNVAEVRQFILPLPPVREQTMIQLQLGGLDRRIAVEGAERDKLNAVKSGLMDDLLTGRVRVSPAQDAAADR